MALDPVVTASSNEILEQKKKKNEKSTIYLDFFLARKSDTAEELEPRNQLKLDWGNLTMESTYFMRLIVDKYSEKKRQLCMTF